MLPVLLLGLVACHVTSSNAFDFSLGGLFGRGHHHHPSDNFSTNLLHEIAKKEHENIVCSPISATIALSMAILGSESTTREQIESVLGISKSEVDLKKVQSTIESLHDSKEVTFRLANRIFVDRRFSVKESYVSAIRKFYSSVQEVNFKHVHAAADVINKWWAALTDDPFDLIIEPSAVDSDSDLVIANVAYFFGLWQDPFPTSQTMLKRFWVRGTDPKDRMTMHNTGRYNYGKLNDVDATFLELPYKSRSDDDGVSMFVVLPNERNGLRQLKRNLGSVTVDKLRKGDKHRVHVSLPKFTIGSTIDLEEPLKNLGVTHMFDRRADFKGISDVRGLKVDDVIQKVVLNVDEGGSRGAGLNVATELIHWPFSHSVDFVVDHPFVCMIVTKSGVTLFSGIINSPSSS